MPLEQTKQHCVLARPQANDAELQEYLEDKVELSEATKAELAVKRATVTPFWWGLKTYLKVSTATVLVFWSMLMYVF